MRQPGIYLLLFLILTGCNFQPTGQAISQIEVTHAYQTLAVELTAATILTSIPTHTTTPSPSPPTDTANTNPTVTTTSFPTSPPTYDFCDQAAPGAPIDVSIPDDAEMLPGQAFTKIWRLQNIGSCAWTKEYGVTWFSGAQLSANPRIPLNASISPGQTVDIAVDMTAPPEPGVYQSNWKLYNSANVLFGIGPAGGSPFWVKIRVIPQPTSSGTIINPTATATPTPPTITSGRIVLASLDKIDLDNQQVNPVTGEDLAHEINNKGANLLVPKSGALIGFYSDSPPGMGDCQNTEMSETPIVVADLSSGDFICYQTNQGFPGRAQFINMNPDTTYIMLDIITWYLP